jgi:hypothetical protein
MTGKRDEHVEDLENLLGKVSLADDVAADRHVKSPAGQKALRQISEHAEDVIRKARRRALGEASAGARAPVAISQRIASMTRKALLARLEELRGIFGGELAVQYRDLAAHSDDDLRSLLADVEANLAKGGWEPEA